MTASTYITFVAMLISCGLIEMKPKLTLDELVDNTEFPSLSFSPDGRHLLFETYKPAWDSDSYENRLWLYNLRTQQKRQIHKNVGVFFDPRWSPNGKWIVLRKHDASVERTSLGRHQYRSLTSNKDKDEKYIHLYSIESDEFVSIPVGKLYASHITWSEDDNSLYFVTTTSQSSTDESSKMEWKDTIEYRKSETTVFSTILQLNIDKHSPQSLSKIHIIKNLTFQIGDLVYSASEQKLVLTSSRSLVENMVDFEIYAIDLQNSFTLSKLTTNQAFEVRLRLSNNGKRVIFQQYIRRSTDQRLNDTQRRLFSIDLRSGSIERLAKDYGGQIVDHMMTLDGSLLIRGQTGVDVQIYKQKSAKEQTIQLAGWRGTYENIKLSSRRNGWIAFIHSSWDQPKEIYLARCLDCLRSAKAITNENELYTRRSLPHATTYQWKNEADNDIIEGILHYPPGQFEAKRLPLLVNIHGGPYDASLNLFEGGWFSLATLAASNGWLVLEPNYCGSTGYGDRFVEELRGQPLTRPGRDILAAVDHLIKEGKVDPKRLAVGGYSYGGYLTNWLITQTTQFKAALSGAGPLEPVSSWGTMDLPALFSHLFGGFPWNMPEDYQRESTIYHLDRVRTPTLIATGADDVRVDADQSYTLERGLHTLGVPVQLLVFPNEDHGLSNNPWHGKILVREQLKWLEKYGQ